MVILGLSGYARSGKDEAAKVLVEEFDYRRIAFADKLREVLYALNPLVVANSEHHGMVPLPSYGGKVFKRLQWVIDEYGWDGYKESPFSDDVRGILQRLGTEAGRQILWDNIWVDAALTGVSTSDTVVVTDVRFPNEADAIKKRGGIMVRINRSGNGPATDQYGNVHKSETSLDDYKFDYTINNDFMVIDDYHQHVRNFMDALATDLYFKNVIGDEV